MPDEFTSEELTPRILYRELQQVQRALVELSRDLREATEAITRFKTEDVAGRLTKLEDGKLHEMDKRVTVLERLQSNNATAVKILYGLMLFALAVFTAWAEWKN